MTSSTRRMFGIAAALFVSATAAQAQGHGHDKERDKDKGHGKHEQEQRRDDRGNPGGVVWTGDQRRADQRDNRNERDSRGERDERDGRNLPPGLAKKAGGLPPGQYKKRYGAQEGAGVLRDIFIQRGYTVVRTDNAGPSQYVYYRLRDGGVRRAIVSPGTDQLSFSNVPAALLREVLSRLY